VAAQRNARILSELHKHCQCVQEENPNACELRMRKRKRCLQENSNAQRLGTFGRPGTHTDVSGATTVRGAPSSSTPTRKRSI